MKIFNIYQVNKFEKDNESGKLIFDWAQLYATFDNEEQAVNFVIRNTTDLHETCFDYVILEEQSILELIVNRKRRLFKFDGSKYSEVEDISSYNLDSWPCLLGSHL